MTVEEYKELLEQHDWFFEFSEDFAVRKRGSNQRHELTRLANNNIVFRQLYRDISKQKYGANYS